jgi:glycosyltransferase involved in cell wall biosynthesis
VALLQDEPRRRRCAAASRRLAEAAYSWPSIANRLLTLYEQLLEAAEAATPA